MITSPIRLAGILCLLAALGAQAQSTQVTGSYYASGEVGAFRQGTYSCSGEPTCTGTHQSTGKNKECSNTYQLPGSFRMTGADLSKTGPITVSITMGNLDVDDQVSASGTCTLVASGDLTFTITGTWDGSKATLHGEYPATNQAGATFTVVADFTFTATRPAPPTPVFPMTVTGAITPQVSNIQAQFQYKPQDVGSNPNVYVYAVAPATRVGKRLAKEAPVPCVLAQLTAAGTLSEVSTATLRNAVDAVISSQGAAVNVLDNVATPNVAGATMFVGYGPSAGAMLANGTNRSVITVPPGQSSDPVCQPQAPTTGWWWNPAEPGRGFSVEVQGNNLFFAGFLYDASGRSTWFVATGPVSMDGAYYTGPLYAARGGQALGGPYPGRPQLTEVGNVTLAFNSATQGTMAWPGGVVPITRQDVVAGGAANPGPQPHPENGWWWNPEESGRGFFMEWQQGTLDMAGYMYDDQGNSVWYLAWDRMPATGNAFSAPWWSFADGQTLTGAWKPNRMSNANVAPVTVTFTSPTTATMTLPNGRTTNLQRHRF